MARLRTSERGGTGRRNETRSTARDGRSSGGRLRKVLLWAGLLGVAYVAVRRAGSGGGPPSPGQMRDRAEQFREDPGGEVREMTDEVRERTDEMQEQAGEVREQAEEKLSGEDESDQESSESGAGDSESGADQLDETELPGEERSDEEIEARGEENVQEEPAEPGEMTVDEDVVDEVVDEESEETATDETDDDQS